MTIQEILEDFLDKYLEAREEFIRQTVTSTHTQQANKRKALQKEAEAQIRQVIAEGIDAKSVERIIMLNARGGAYDLTRLNYEEIAAAIRRKVEGKERGDEKCNVR